MDQVFAPWRIEWVERQDKNEGFDECVFCELPERDEDRNHYVLARSERSYVLLNNYPYNPGHALVIPNVHTGRFQDLDADVLLEMHQLLQRTLDAMDDALSPEGYNVGYNLGGSAAGGSIDSHLHAHVVPRWSGDTNFMPVVSETKVIVEAVTDTYGRLHETFGMQEGVSVEDESTAVRVESVQRADDS